MRRTLVRVNGHILHEQISLSPEGNNMFCISIRSGKTLPFILLFAILSTGCAAPGHRGNLSADRCLCESGDTELQKDRQLSAG